MALSKCLGCGTSTQKGVLVCGPCCDRLSKESPLWTMDWGISGKGLARRLQSDGAVIFLGYPSRSGRTKALDSGRFDPPRPDELTEIGQARFSAFLNSFSNYMALAGVPTEIKSPAPPIAQEDIARMSAALADARRGVEIGYALPSNRACLQFASLLWRAKPSKALSRILEPSWVAAANAQLAGEAERFVKLALSIAPKDKDALRAMAELLQETGRAAEAVRYTEGVAEQEADSVEGWLGRGDALALAGNHYEAIRCFDRALALDAGSPDAWESKGDSLSSLGRYAEARACYDMALRKRPNDEKIILKRADTLARLGEIDQSAAAYPIPSRKPDVLIVKPPARLEESRSDIPTVDKSREPSAPAIPEEKVPEKPQKARGLAEMLSGFSEIAPPSGEPVDELHELEMALTGGPPEREPESTTPEPSRGAAEPQETAPSFEIWPDKKNTQPKELRPVTPDEPVVPTDTDVAVVPPPPDVEKNPEQSDAAARIEEEIDEVLSAAPDPRVEALLDKADRLVEADEFELALSVYEEVLGIVADDEEAVAGKARSLANIGRSDEGFALLERHLKDAPSSLILLEAKGDALATVGDARGAVKAYEAALEQDREDGLLWNKKGEALLQLRKYEDALTSFNASVELDERHADAWLGIGDSFFGLGKLDEAYKCFDRALELDPDLTEAWYKKGTVLEAKGRWGGALQLYEKAIAIDPEYGEPRLRIAGAYADRQKFAEALKSYDDVLSRHPTDPRAMTGKATAYNMMGRWGAALQLLEILTKDHPEHAPGWVLHGRIMRSQRQADKAVADFDRALAADPECVAAMVEKAEVLQENGAVGEALKLFKAANELDTKNARAWLGVAESLKEMGDAANSVAAYDRSINIAPKDARLWLRRGVALHEFERFVEAIESYRKALDIAPGLEEAKRWLERSQKRLDDGGSA